MKNIFITSGIFMLISTLYLLNVFSQTSNQKVEIIKIEKYVKTLDDFVKKTETPHLIFADVSQDEKPKWQKFESEAALEKFREKSETYSISYNWQKNRKIVAANFTLFSESGDWAKYVYLYFREDGTLAKVESELNTFYGNFSFLQDIYFDQNGDVLKNTSKYLDLKTKKPKSADKSDIFDNGDRINPFYFKTINQLPYIHLNKQK